MAKLSESDLRAIINSDMKLWERASTGPHPHGIAKTFDLPYGIGERTVVFPESDKGAVESFGSIIRGWVDEVKGERAAEEARLERLAAEARLEADRADAGGSTEGDLDADGTAVPAESLEVAAKAAEPPHAIFEAGPESFAGRRDALLGGVEQLNAYIKEANKRLKRYQKELLAIDAALEIMNASEDDEAESGGPEAEVEGPGS